MDSAEKVFAKHAHPAFCEDSTDSRQRSWHGCWCVTLLCDADSGLNIPMHAMLRSLLPSLFAAVLGFSFPVLCAAQTASDFSSVAAGAAAAREGGNREEAIVLYQQAVAMRADWTEGWWYLGTLCYDTDRYADAIAALKKVTELAPDLGSAWSFLGLSEFESKSYVAAQSDLEKGLALGSGDDPETARVAKFHLALLQIRSGQFEGARKLLAPQYTSPPVSDQVRTALGLLLLRVAMLPQESDPSKDALLLAAGELQLQLIAGKSGAALSTIQTLVARHVENPAEHEILARCYDALHMPAEAAKERAIISQAKTVSTGTLTSDRQIIAFFLRDGGEPIEKNEPGAANRDSREFDDLSRGAAAAEQSGDFATAIPLYEHALRLRPDWNEGQFRLAMLYYSAKQFSAAIASLKLWLERNPNNGTAWAVLGLSEFETRDFDNALIHLQRGEALGLGASADSIRNAYYHEAILLNRKSEFSRAAQILSGETSSGVLENETRLALGMAFLRIPHLPDEMLIAQRPLMQRTGEAAALLAGSKYDLALPKLHDLVQEFPQAPFLHYVYGSALASLSMFDEAAVQFEAEARISPRSELPLVELAALNLQRHTAKEALSPAQRAVEIAGASAAAHYILGRVDLELGRGEAAVKELEAAASILPGSPEIHFHLARAYARQNRPEKAAAERASFVHLNALAEQQRGSTASQSYGAVRPTPGGGVTESGAQPSAPPR